MKKRILSIVLAVLMLVSVLPVTAMAADGPTDTGAESTQTAVGAGSPDGAIHVNKSISDDGTTLTLEAYLTNKVIQTVSTKPLDIVLVLDQSGSMAYDFDGEYTNKDENRRQYAMKQAVKTFIGKVNEQYSDQGNHQMAIVTFAGNAKQLIGWTAVDNNGKSALINAINGLPGNPPEGATNVGAGMKKAQELMNSKTDANRQKIVIVFTDGVPTTHSEFDTDVANTAIQAAKAMKDKGTFVYTVGIFNGANPSEMYGASGFDKNSNGTVGSIWKEESWGLFPSTDFPKADRPAGNRFLNLVSNNYPSADSIGLERETIGLGILRSGISYKVTKNFKRAAEGSYYLTANSAKDLNQIFQQIVNEISTLKTEAGTDTILSDTLSQYFALDIPAGTEAKNSITVEKWDCTDKDENGYTWVKAATQPPLNVEVSGKTIKVNGFDYTQNAVTETVKEGNTTFSGSKLVVTIPIKPDTGYTDWKYGTKDYPTNDTDNSKAGLEYGETGSRQKVELTESPEAPVTGYKVTYQVTSKNNPAYTEVKDDTVYLKGQTATVKPVPTTDSTSNGNLQGKWRFDGWYEGDVKINTETIEINDDVTLTGEWKFTENIKYGVKYEYVSSDPTNHPLPTEISTPDGTGDYAVSDATEYYVDAIVTRKSPAKDTYEDTANKGTWTLTWDKNEATMTAEGVTFTGTWSFEALPQPGLRVTKTAKVNGEALTAGEKAKVGDTITYTITVTNTGNTTLENVTIEDTFHGAGTLKDVQNNDAVVTLSEDGKFTIDVGTLGTAEADKTKTYTYTYVVVAKDAGTNITNNVVAESGDTTHDGGTVIPVKNQYTVSYAFVSDTEGQTLPEEVRNQVPIPQTVDEGAVVTPSKTFNAVNVTGGTWTFVKWDEDSKTVSDGNVTFTGTWTFEAAEQPKYTLSYQFVSGTEGETLPTMTNPDSVQLEEGAALTVPTVDPTTVADQANNGSWTFKGWYLDTELNNPVQDTDTMPAEAKTIYGKWEFTKAVQPPQTKYEITLTISKELKLRSGSHPGEKTFLFDVSYKPDNGSYQYIDTVDITLADRETDKQKTVTIEVSKEVYEAIWNQALVCVEERNLNENGFEYDTTPRFGKAEIFSINIDGGSVEIRPNVPGGNTPLKIKPDNSDFDFVNYYGKSGKVEKPVKVGPQLNRDDHVAYIMGYPDGTVQPEGEITRAEACTIFFRLLTDSSRDYYFARTNDYSDVNAGDWFNNAISTLSNAGIVTGYNDGTFRPNQPITRGEMAKIIANFANLNKGTKSFTDLSGHWSKTYVELAAGNGWIAGYPDGSFRPDQKITRAETVTMINRVLDRVPAKESRLLSRSIMLTFPDNKPGDWYYIAIQEASNSHEYRRSVYETTGDEMWTKLIDNVDWTKLEK